MSNSNIYDLIIIGGGAGGLTAGIYAMRAVLKTALIEMGASGGQMNNSDIVENWPGDEHIDGAELSVKFHQHAESYGLKMVSQEVVGLEPGLDYHTVKLDDGNELKTHAIILATGGSPRKLNIPGEEENNGKGVSYCAVCDGFFFRDKTVAIVGGGDTAAEESLYLAKLAKQVYIVHRRDELRAGALLQQRVKSNSKIEILWNSVVTEIKANDNGVCAVTLEDTQNANKRDLAVEGVFVFIGFKPNNKLVPAGVKMNADGYVVTNQNCETKVPGLYVIGDLREKPFRQIVISASDGATAALTAAHYVETLKS